MRLESQRANAREKSGGLQSLFLNRQVRQDRQERKEGSGESSCFSTSFLGALGVLGGFS